MRLLQLPLQWRQSCYYFSPSQNYDHEGLSTTTLSVTNVQCTLLYSQWGFYTLKQKSTMQTSNWIVIGWNGFCFQALKHSSPFSMWTSSMWSVQTTEFCKWMLCTYSRVFPELSGFEALSGKICYCRCNSQTELGSYWEQ